VVIPKNNQNDDNVDMGGMGSPPQPHPLTPAQEARKSELLEELQVLKVQRAEIKLDNKAVRDTIEAHRMAIGARGEILADNKEKMRVNDQQFSEVVHKLKNPT